MTPTQAERAAHLRDLHVPGHPLVVVNAWDAASARAVAALPDCRAVATASHAISASLGYEDGEGTPLAEMIAAVRRVCAAVDLPVTADLEAGYGDAGTTTREAMEAGAVGANLEDSDLEAEDGTLVGAAEHADAVAAMRRAAEHAGIPFVINARTDVYLRQVGEPGERVALAAERANRYAEAGADCCFVPGVTDLGEIRALVEAISAPVSVIAGPKSASVAELARAGVARISVGPWGHRTALAAYAAAASEIYERGSFGTLGG
jgi:2-methylisocitrate lyase-like PEP mutase family enzyme